MAYWPPREVGRFTSSKMVAGRIASRSPHEDLVVPSLFVIQGRDQGTRYRLDGSTITLGRGTSNAVQLHDTEISREHAEFSRRGEQYFIRDLESSNGTLLNGKQVKEHDIASGDHLQLGR